MMSEITIELEEDFTTVPSKDIKNFYYIGKELFIQTENENYKLNTLAQKQLFYHLGLLWKTRLNLNRDILIASAIHNRAVKEKHSLVFRKLRYYKDHVQVGSVVTTKYIEIPVGEVREKFETSLANLKLGFKLLNEDEGIRADYFTYGITSAKSLEKSKISSDLTLIVGHSGDKSIEIVNGFVVEKCGNRLEASKFAVLIHRDDPKSQILDSLQKVTFYAVKRLKPALEKIIHAESSKEVENIQQLFAEVIQEYPLYIRLFLREKFYGKYKHLKSLWRISQTLSDVGTNGEVSQTQKPRLQEHAYQILTMEK